MWAKCRDMKLLTGGTCSDICSKDFLLVDYDDDDDDDNNNNNRVRFIILYVRLSKVTPVLSCCQTSLH